MTKFLFIRHAPTHWNRQKRLQGQTDIPLSPKGEEQAHSWQLPTSFKSWRLLCSPLERAQQTAQSIGNTPPIVEPRLTEMNFGDWEGKTLKDLRQKEGHAFKENEDRGLDFTPPHGESPRMVQQRLLPLLYACATQKQDTVFITHKGVIRAALAFATHWDMLGKAPFPKVVYGVGFLLCLEEDAPLVYSPPLISLKGETS